MPADARSSAKVTVAPAGSASVRRPGLRRVAAVRRPGLRRVAAGRRADLSGRDHLAAPAVQSCGAGGGRVGRSASSSMRRTLTTAAVITVPRAITEVTPMITRNI